MEKIFDFYKKWVVGFFVFEIVLCVFGFFWDVEMIRFLGFLLALIFLGVIWIDRKFLMEMQLNTRLKLRGVFFIQLFFCIIFFSQLPLVQAYYDKFTIGLQQKPICEKLPPLEKSCEIANQNEVAGTGHNIFHFGKNDTEKVDASGARDEISAWGTLFAWLLAAIALVITFVTSWVYAIAKEGRENWEKVLAANGLDKKIKTIESVILRSELHIAIRTFFDEYDEENVPRERYFLKTIKSSMILQEKMLDDKANLQDLKLKLERKYQTLHAYWQNGNLADEAISIIHNHYLPYLDDLISRFRAHHNAGSPHGAECLEQLNQFWRLFSR